MKIKKTQTGKTMVQATLAGMCIGDVWALNPEIYSIRYLRVLASTYGSAVNKSFTVNAPNADKGTRKITITRTR